MRRTLNGASPTTKHDVIERSDYVITPRPRVRLNVVGPGPRRTDLGPACSLDGLARPVAAVSWSIRIALADVRVLVLDFRRAFIWARSASTGCGHHDPVIHLATLALPLSISE